VFATSIPDARETEILFHTRDRSVYVQRGSLHTRSEGKPDHAPQLADPSGLYLETGAEIGVDVNNPISKLIRAYLPRYPLSP
jgi:hypothetical protein